MDICQEIWLHFNKISDNLNSLSYVLKHLCEMNDVVNEFFDRHSKAAASKHNCFQTLRTPIVFIQIYAK